MNTLTHGLPPRAGLSQIAMTTTDLPSNPAAQVFVPDALSLPDAASRVTHLGVGAHHDDLEFMAFHGIVECMDHTDRWFGGVTCTDGRGSSRSGVFAEMSPEELGSVRAKEQNEAAVIGQYGIMFQLGYPSSAVTNPADTRLREDLVRILKSTLPEVVYTHSPADKHRTHLGVFASLLHALRALPLEERPKQLIGCEVWRDLDWMLDSEKVRMDVSGHDALAHRLNTVFASQIVGGKRYDLATVGRRQANATFHTSHATDKMLGITWAMDLTPLVRDTTLSFEEFTLAHIRRLHDDVQARMRKFA
jgi:LmbE family N-acetylglucosaminyl deacetylase